LERWVAPIGKVGGTDWKGGWHRLRAPIEMSLETQLLGDGLGQSLVFFFLDSQQSRCNPGY
jgi:hypothetical protein